MKPNLDALKTEIEQYLEETGLAVFYGYSRALESTPAVYWDCDQYPDYRRFVQAARTAGAKIIVFHQRTFLSEQVDDALEQLSASNLPREEHREFEQRLTEMRRYDGFVSAIELSFDHEGRVFLFDLRTEWYDELTEILDEIQALAPDEDDGTMGGYFSKN
jgi:hypothetical protein